MVLNPKFVLYSKEIKERNGSLTHNFSCWYLVLRPRTNKILSESKMAKNEQHSHGYFFHLVLSLFIYLFRYKNIITSLESGL